MRFATLALVLTCGLSFVSSVEAQNLQTEQDKTFYALGLAIGGQVKDSVQAFKLTPAELAIVTAGLNDSLTGKQAKVDLNTYGPKIQGIATERAAAAATVEKQAAGAFIAQMAKEKDAQRSASGVIYIPVKAGTGASPTATSTVKVHYHGTLRDGTVFDSSVQRGQPISFPLNGVIPCWTEGVQKMKVGGKAKLVCPSDTAYGDQGQGPIPGGATLVFEVELLEIEK
jgi:FKBP-type peptidyl-prolyl cis-trans isomerase FkpA